MTLQCLCWHAIFQTNVKQRKVDHGCSRRQSSFQYKLKLQDGTEKVVCKSLFASTFGVPARTVVSWLEEFKDPSFNEKSKLPRTPKSGIHVQL
jgi:hypothetical protein